MPRPSKTFWIINQYASTPDTGMGGRHYNLAKELSKLGYKVYLVAASYTHLLRSAPTHSSDFMIEPKEGFSFVWVKTSEYSHAHDKKRIWNWFKFSWKLRKLSDVIKDKPDAILASSPSPFVFFGAKKLAKKFNAKLAFEVRDIWPLSLVELGNFSPRNLFIQLMQWTEDRAYQDSDVVLSNLPNVLDHMISRGMSAEKFHWIPNGFNLDEIEQTEALSQETISSLPTDKFIVGYTGTFGLANALDHFIEAANLLKEHLDICFVLVGDGKEKQNLLKKSENLENVIFVNPIPKSQIQSMLSAFDVCYIGLTKDPLFKYGVSPNKLFDYFCAAKPIIYAIESGEYRPVDEAVAGVSIPAENPQAIADAVLEIKSMPLEKRTQLGENGRNHAFKHHDYAKLAFKLAEILE